MVGSFGLLLFPSRLGTCYPCISTHDCVLQIGSCRWLQRRRDVRVLGLAFASTRCKGWRTTSTLHVCKAVLPIVNSSSTFHSYDCGICCFREGDTAECCGGDRELFVFSVPANLSSRPAKVKIPASSPFRFDPALQHLFPSVSVFRVERYAAPSFAAVPLHLIKRRLAFNHVGTFIPPPRPISIYRSRRCIVLP